MLHKQLTKRRNGLVWIPYWGEKGKWWENIGCITIIRVVFEPVSAVKSLPSFLASFLGCHKDIANLPRYFGHA